MKNLPAWFPGAGFKTKAREWKETTYKMRDLPFNAAIADMVSISSPKYFRLSLSAGAKASGKVSPCVVSQLLSDEDAKTITPDHLETVRNCAGLAYAGKIY